MLADDMGLGKTRQALSVLRRISSENPQLASVVVKYYCPRPRYLGRGNLLLPLAIPRSTHPADDPPPSTARINLLRPPTMKGKGRLRFQGQVRVHYVDTNPLSLGLNEYIQPAEEGVFFAEIRGPSNLILKISPRKRG